MAKMMSTGKMWCRARTGGTCILESKREGQNEVKEEQRKAGDTVKSSVLQERGQDEPDFYFPSSTESSSA